MQKGKVFIIAEAGVNHNGSLELAKELAKSAKRAGADAVKFQTFRTENLATKYTEQAEYQSVNIGKEESQAEMLSRLELTYAEFQELYEYCQEIGILFLSTAFDLESVDFLAGLDMAIWKIPSGEITNLPYLEKIADLKKPIILSTGMAEMGDIEAALTALKGQADPENHPRITVLHCTTEYPTPDEDVNLRAMQTIKEKFHVPVGYSDHTEGILVSLLAVAMGAEVIEKHITLDKNMEGPDHKASLDISELTELVNQIRRIELILGSGIKSPTKAEFLNRKVARKCIVAKRQITRGEIFSRNNLTVKRAGYGISPMKWYEVIGKTAERDFVPDEIIEVSENV